MISVQANYSIDDSRGETSTCHIIVFDESDTELYSCEVTFTNGDGCEGEDGQMEPSVDSELDDSQVKTFEEDIIVYITTDLNPYPQELENLVYQNNGADQHVLDSPCVECGKYGISIDENFYPVGYCCYCGAENELRKCHMCGELYTVDEGDENYCQACLNKIEKDEAE